MDVKEGFDIVLYWLIMITFEMLIDRRRFHSQCRFIVVLVDLSSTQIIVPRLSSNTCS